VVRTTTGGEANALTSLVGGSDEFAQRYLKDPVVVAWGPSSPGRDEGPVVEAITAFAREHNAKVLACPPHAGSQGMIDMGVHPALDAGHQLDSSPGRGTRQILEAAALGELDALILFGADPISDFPDANLARRALEAGVFTVVVELFPTDPVAYADVVLPSTAYAEREGTFTNLERRIQKLEQLLAPPGTSRDPWQIAAAIARALDDDWDWRGCNDVWDDIRTNVPTHSDVRLDQIQQEMPAHSLQYETGFQTKTHEAPLSIAGPGAQYPKGYRSGAPFQTGQNWPLSWELRAFEARQRPGFVPPIPEHGAAPEEASAAAQHNSTRREASDGGAAPRAGSSGDASSSGSAAKTFALYSGRFIYDEGAMVSRSAYLRQLQKKPFIEMNELDVKELGLSDGDLITVSADGFEAQLNISVSDIARGAVFVPYDQRGLKANELMRGVNPTVEVRAA
jgi:anaerobic selenocysteine-containing dehydrogenase